MQIQEQAQLIFPEGIKNNGILCRGNDWERHEAIFWDK